MPKIFGREVPPIILGGVGIAGAYLLYTVMFGGDDPVATKKKVKPPVKQTIGQTDYLPVDYTVQFSPLPDKTDVKDAFKPLVVKSSLSPSGVPSIDNYTYSGMAVLNGVANGLLENSQTGQGDFVKAGDRWHSQWLVVSLNADEIALKNDGGDVTHLQAGALAAKAATTASAAQAGGNVPVNPMMVGPIGGSDLSLQQDPTQMQGGQGGGRRRGGGRGRGGGGGGGNFNGGGGFGPGMGGG